MKKIKVPLKQYDGMFGQLEFPRHFVVSVKSFEKQPDGSYKEIDSFDPFDYKGIIEAFYKSNHDAKLSIWLNCAFAHKEIRILKEDRIISLESEQP